MDLQSAWLRARHRVGGHGGSSPSLRLPCFVSRPQTLFLWPLPWSPPHARTLCQPLLSPACWQARCSLPLPPPSPGPCSLPSWAAEAARTAPRELPMDRSPQRHPRASQGKRLYGPAGRWKGLPGGAGEEQMGLARKPGGEWGDGLAGERGRVRQDGSGWKLKETREEELGTEQRRGSRKGEKQEIHGEEGRGEPGERTQVGWGRREAPRRGSWVKGRVSAHGTRADAAALTP